MMIQCNMILLIFMLFPIPTCIQQILNKFKDCPLDAKPLSSNQLPNPETWGIILDPSLIPYIQSTLILCNISCHLCPPNQSISTALVQATSICALDSNNSFLGWFCLWLLFPLLSVLYRAPEVIGTDWFQIRKGVHQGCILSPCSFNLYAEYIMWNPGLEKHKLESSLLGEISITSDMQMTPPLWQKVKN